MTAFLEKNHLSDFIGIDIIEIAKDKYNVKYEDFQKQYEAKNVNAAFYAEVISKYIVPDLIKAISIIVTGDKSKLNEVIDPIKAIEKTQSRFKRLVEKGTPKFILNRLEKAAEVSPFISLLGLPYQIATSKALTYIPSLFSVLNVLQSRDALFVLIKSTEFGLKVAEETVRFALVLKDEFVDKDFPKNVINGPVNQLREIFDFENGSASLISIVTARFSGNYLTNSIDQAFKNAGINGLNIINLISHYNNLMGQPQATPELIEPITFPLFGTTVRLNTTSSAVNLRPPVIPPVTPPVEPPTDEPSTDEPEPPTEPPVQPIDEYAPIAEFNAYAAALSAVIQQKIDFIKSIEVVKTLYQFDQDYINQIKLAYALVLYAHKVSLLGDISPVEYAEATRNTKYEVFANQLVNLTNIIPQIEQWESQGNRIENYGDPAIDNRYISFEQAQYALYTLAAINFEMQLAKFLEPALTDQNSPLKPIIDRDAFYTLSIADKEQAKTLATQRRQIMESIFGPIGNFIIPSDTNGGLVSQFVRARREEFFSQPELIAAEEQAGVYRFSYLLTDGNLPTSNFYVINEPENPPPSDSDNEPYLIELSNFVQSLINETAMAGVASRIIASGYSALMQKIFSSNVAGGVLEFEGVTVEVTNPEAMVTQLPALKEKVLSLLISIPESSTMFANFSLIKSRIMDDSNNPQELADLVRDTVTSVYKANDISEVETTVFSNVLGLNVIGNTMAGIDPNSNAIDLSRILLGIVIESINEIDSKAIMMSFDPVYQWYKQLT